MRLVFESAASGREVDFQLGAGGQLQPGVHGRPFQLYVSRLAGELLARELHGGFANPIEVVPLPGPQGFAIGCQTGKEHNNREWRDTLHVLMLSRCGGAAVVLESWAEARPMPCRH